MHFLFDFLRDVSHETIGFETPFGQVLEIAKSQVGEILIFGIPEASGLRGSIRLVKLVSTLLARAYNLPYGAKIYQKNI